MSFIISCFILYCKDHERRSRINTFFLLELIRSHFWFVLFSFCGLIKLNFLLHLLDILKYFKGNVHTLVIKYPRMTLRGKVVVTVLSCLPYSKFIHSNHTAHKIMFMSVHCTHIHAGLYTHWRAHAIMCQPIKSRGPF